MARRYVPRDGEPKSLRGAWVTEHVPAADEIQQPSPSAPKPDWEDYAARLGVDIDGMTKEQIIDQVS